MTDSYVRTSELLTLIRRVFRALLAVTVIVGGAGVAIGTITFGAAGLWAALMAAVLGLFFTATTVAGLYYAAGRGQQALMVVLLGGWLVKMVILGAVIFWLKNQTFYHKPTFGATIIVLVLGALVAEMVIVATAKIPYVDVNSVTTAPSGSGEQPGASAREAHEPAEKLDDGEGPAPPDRGKP